MGKGSRQRQELVHGSYDIGWERIFGQKKKEKQESSDQEIQDSTYIAELGSLLSKAASSKLPK